jgi:hypothetical protein
MSKLIIAGSRDLNLHYPLCISDFVTHFLDISRPKEIVSGGAKGIDIAGEEYAATRYINIKRFLPDYKSYPSKVAPIMRNKEMAKYADGLLLIWDGESRGSANMKEEMLKLNKKVYEVIIKKHNA